MPLLRKRKKDRLHADVAQSDTPSVSSPPTATPPLRPPSTTPASQVSIAGPTPRRDGGTDSTPPRSFAELEDLVQEVVSGSWDPSIPINSWRRALSQLAQEAKVYYNEGNIDLAFVRSATVLKLSSQVLPKYHPGWQSLSPSNKVDVAKLAADYSTNYSALRDELMARSAAYYASIRAATEQYNPALSLRNTVQPSSMSMTDSGKSEEYYRSLSQRHEGANDSDKGKGAAGPRSNKLRKAFGMRGRTDSQKSGSSNGQLGSVTSGTRLPAPGSEEKDEEAKIFAMQTAPSSSSHASTPSVNVNNLPLPGEDDSDVEYEDETKTSITYALSNPIPPTPDWSQLPATYLPNPNLPATHSTSSYTYPVRPHPPNGHLATSQPQFYPSSSDAPFASPRVSPTPPVRPPLPPTPPADLRWRSNLPLPIPPTPPIPPLPPQFALAATPISSPFSKPASPGDISGRPSSTDTTKDLLRLSTAVPPVPSAPSTQASSPSPQSHWDQGCTDSIASPSSTPSLHRSSSIASVPVELYGSSSLSRGSQRRKRGGGESARVGLSSLDDIGEALPEHDGSEKAPSSEAQKEPGWFAQTEAGNPLRPIFLPAGLISHFVNVVARPNTERDIETCGLLLGHLSRNQFTVTTLLIPKQDGTPDTCVTTHEEEQFEFQDSRGLMTLGWIHTHPTQSIFLSSVDLHTHSSYQIMLQEAIAIVAAPRHEPNFGIFRLTDPPGLETIVKCRDKGLFHPHPDLPLYTDVDADYGHCRLRSYQFETHDLRRN